MPDRVAIYPGTFDPVTHGHLDILQRGIHLFDRVIVAVARSAGKAPLFTVDERVDLVQRAAAPLGDRVQVEGFGSLLVEFARRHNASAIIRGLRAVADFEFEFQLALMNRRLAPELETVFLMPKENLIYLSSSLIKEISRLGGDVSSFVPPHVLEALRTRRAAH
jgi:pantetheine-phosphate adenylyltransferase